MCFIFFFNFLRLLSDVPLMLYCIGIIITSCSTRHNLQLNRTNQTVKEKITSILTEKTIGNASNIVRSVFMKSKEIWLNWQMIPLNLSRKDTNIFFILLLQSWNIKINCLLSEYFVFLSTNITFLLFKGEFQKTNLPD